MDVVKPYAGDSLPVTHVIRQLALEWLQGHLPAERLTFVDCLNVLTDLQAATQNVDQTTAIFEIVFNQASELGKSSEWLATELQFETLAQHVLSRVVLVLLYLEHGGGAVNDDALDLYNERLRRFDDATPRPDSSDIDYSHRKETSYLE